MDRATEGSTSIGEALKILKARWPELSHSMIRFWEKEGLIQLHRTEGGHRVFCRTDMERLHLIAELRQRRYLPLSMVRRLLKEIDSDPTADLSIYDEIFQPEEYNPDFKLLSKNELARLSGLRSTQIDEFEILGFFPYEDEGNKRRLFDEGELKTAQLLCELVQHGFEPKELDFYVDDLSEHIRNETQLMRKVLGECTGESERHEVYRQVQNTIRKLRSLLYRKLGRQAMVKLLEEE